MNKIKAAILGPGNIGADLMYKIIRRAKNIELVMVSGILAGSPGLELAAKNGFKTALDGVESILADPEIKIVFEATSAKAHCANAPRYKKAGKIAINLTPAAIGIYTVPAVNLNSIALDADNLNMVTCGGQATVPMVAAVSKVTAVPYAEIISTIASKSAGPGTRANIDEFTETTAAAVVQVGGAQTGKAIIILNPAEPPILMRNTVYCRVAEPDKIDQITESVLKMTEKVKNYVPGYRLRLAPTLDGDCVTIMIEVEGEGDYLPKYSGNLDIITATALASAEKLAANMMLGR
jgi:acetaldehyde dehydrogenase